MAYEWSVVLDVEANDDEGNEVGSLISELDWTGSIAALLTAEVLGTACFLACKNNDRC